MSLVHRHNWNIWTKKNFFFPNYRGSIPSPCVQLSILLPSVLTSLPSTIVLLLMYVHRFFAKRLFILGHLYSLLLHATYILSLFSLLSSFSNAFFLRNSFLRVFTSFGTWKFSQTYCYKEFELAQLSYFFFSLLLGIDLS